MTEQLQPLVRKAIAGDSEAFGALYTAYFDNVYDFLVRLTRNPDDAADLAQETFLRAMDGISALREPASFKSWLFSIAHHAALTRFREAGRYRPIDAPDGIDGASRYDIVDTDRFADPEAAAAAQEVRTLVWDAVAALDPKQRAVLTLHVREGMDVPDLAASLGVSRNSAGVILHRARKALEEAVGAAIVARAGTRRCPELAAIVAPADDELAFNAALRTDVEAHIETCGVCRATRRKHVPLAVFGALAPVAAPAGLRESILDSLLPGDAAQSDRSERSDSRQHTATDDKGVHAQATARSRASADMRLVLRVALVAALFVVIGGLIIAALVDSGAGSTTAGAAPESVAPDATQPRSSVSPPMPVVSTEAGGSAPPSATAEPPAETATPTPTPTPTGLPGEPSTPTPAPAPIQPGDPELPLAPPGGDPDPPPPTEAPPPVTEQPPPVTPETSRPVETGESNRSCVPPVTVSPRMVNLSAANPAARIQVAATGNCTTPVTVSISGVPAWLELSAHSVDVTPGSPVDIKLALVARHQPPDDARATLVFAWEGGSAQVAVIFIAEDRSEPREPVTPDVDDDDDDSGSPPTGPGDITSPPTSPTPPCSSIICS